MVANYLDDHEQIEMIKQWWQNYGRFLAIALVIGLAAGFAWRMWHTHQLKNNLVASQTYQQMLIADSKTDMINTNTLANELLNQYPKTPYAELAAFLLAKNAIDDNQLSQALPHLQWVIDHGKTASFRQMARIRIARILLAQKQSDAALQQLSIIEDASFEPEINIVKGDIYSSLNQVKKAKEAYQLAQKQLAANSMEDNLLQLKLTQP